MDEEEAPRRTVSNWPPKSLEELSVAALENYRAALEAEIARVSRTLESKKRAQSAAAQIFRK
jgi:uncharacterized small protein (DUF1192 family)